MIDMSNYSIRKGVIRMTMFKKALGAVLVLVMLSFNLGIVETNAAEKYGHVSFYDGEGSVGSDGKVLTKYDVAVGIADKHVPKGTTILTLNTDTNIKKTLYKWDYGSFGGTVILDIQRSMFIEMGGVINDGYFNGRIMY